MTYRAIGKMTSRLQRMWLIRSSAIFVTLGLVRGVSQFAFVLLMTRLLLPADYGIYSNFLYTTTMLSPLFFLKSDMPVAHYYSLHPKEIASYIGTIVILCSGLTACSTLMLSILHGTISEVTGLPASWQYLILITCWTYGLFLVVLAVLQIEMRAWAMSLARIMPTITCEISAMLLVFMTLGGWRTALAAYAAVSSVWGATFLFWLRRHGYLLFSFSGSKARDFLSVSLPLIPMAIGFMCVQISAQFILTHYHGTAQVGIYAAANQFSLGVWLLASSAQQAFLPWLFRALQRQPTEDWKIVGATMGIIAILGGCTIIYVLLFKLIFPLVIGARFARGSVLLGQLAWANFFLGIQMAMNCFLYHRKKVVASAAVACFAAGCGIGLGLWTIPAGGALAAASATEISAALIAFFTSIVAIWEFRKLFATGLRDGWALLKARAAGNSA